MTDTTKTTITEEQYAALRHLHNAASSLMRAVVDLERSAQRTADQLRSGHSVFGLSHQLPADIFRYEARLELSAQMALAVGVDAEDVQATVQACEDSGFIYSHFTLAP